MNDEIWSALFESSCTNSGASNEIDAASKCPLLYKIPCTARCSKRVELSQGVKCLCVRQWLSKKVSIASPFNECGFTRRHHKRSLSAPRVPLPHVLLSGLLLFSARCAMHHHQREEDTRMISQYWCDSSDRCHQLASKGPRPSAVITLQRSHLIDSLVQGQVCYDVPTCLPCNLHTVRALHLEWHQ